LSTTSEEAVIEFDILFKTSSQNMEDVKKQREKLVGKTEKSEQDLAGDLLKSEQKEADALAKKKLEGLEKIEDFIGDVDKKGLKTLASIAKDPNVAVETSLIDVIGRMGPHGKIAIAIIGLVTTAPTVITAIVKALAVKGSFLNQDYHRFFEDEQQLGLSREVQYRRAVGLDVIITNDNRGFILSDPGFVGNSLVDVEKTRSIRTSSEETQYGYTSGM